MTFADLDSYRQKTFQQHAELVDILQEMVNQFGHYCEYGEEDKSELAVLNRAINILARIKA